PPTGWRGTWVGPSRALGPPPRCAPLQSDSARSSRVNSPASPSRSASFILGGSSRRACPARAKGPGLRPSGQPSGARNLRGDFPPPALSGSGAGVALRSISFGPLSLPAGPLAGIEPRSRPRRSGSPARLAGIFRLCPPQRTHHGRTSRHHEPLVPWRRHAADGVVTLPPFGVGVFRIEDVTRG